MHSLKMEVEDPNPFMNDEFVPFIESDMQLQIQLEELLQTNIFEEEQPPKRRKKKSSPVWDDFTIVRVDDECRRAICNRCSQSFAYSKGTKVSGTSHLMRHIARGTCNKNNNQLSAPAPPKRQQQKPNNVSPDHEIAKMIIMHEYPLHMVEHSGFVAFVRSLQPRYTMASFDAVQNDCVALYLREKQRIQGLIEGVPGRISLTLDLWSSSSSTRGSGYMFVTGQFIDSDWKFHRRLLNVIMLPYPESDTAFSHSVSVCLSDWNLDSKLFSATINQPLNDAAMNNLRGLGSVKSQLLVGNCLARSLSCIVQEALASVQGLIDKIRDRVQYVEANSENFIEFNNKNLAIDDQNHWNTTYEMLRAASELKGVFPSDYEDALTEDDWRQVETVTTYLKPLFETATLLTTSTTDLITAFFDLAWHIQLDLARAAATSQDPFIATLHDNFDRYWSSSCFILAISVAMDPRFKLKVVEFSFSRIYGEGDVSAEYVKIVDDRIHERFNEYVDLTTPADCPDVYKDFDDHIKPVTLSELDRYLKEPVLQRRQEFDVLGWWKENQVMYPTLSKMARDILAIPICTVPKASVFDTVRKEMDGYRCSLRPETVEALICAKEWMSEDGSVPV